jgi:hypothetical protein
VGADRPGLTGCAVVTTASCQHPPLKCCLSEIPLHSDARNFDRDSHACATGGRSPPLDVSTSIGSCLGVIAAAMIEHSGCYVNYDGTALPF